MIRAVTYLLILLMALALLGPVLAQVPPGIDLSWHVLSGGGGQRGSANYQLDDALGQWADGRSASDHYQLDPGFWHAGRVVETRRVFLPLAIDGSG